MSATTEVKPPSKRGKQPKAVKQPKDKTAKAAPHKETVWPSSHKPSLVFLPENIRSAQAYKRSVRQAMGIAILALALTGAAYAGVAANTLSAKADLNTETARSTALKQEIGNNQQVQEYYDGFILSKQAVSDTLAQDTAYSRVLNAVAAANTVGAKFTEVAKNEQDKCVTNAPFTTSKAVGCFKLSGRVPDMASVGTFADALQSKSEVLTSAVVTEANSATSEGTNFTIIVGYTSEAVSGKGAEFSPTPQELAALNTDPAPEAATTTDGAAK